MALYKDFLNTELTKRKTSNDLYSLRKFAKDLEIPPSTLNGVLKGTSKLSPQKCSQIARKLDLNREDSLTLIFSALSEKKTIAGLLGKEEVEFINKEFLS